MKRVFLLFFIMVLADMALAGNALAGTAAMLKDLGDQLEAARRSHDDAAMESVQRRLLDIAKDIPEKRYLLERLIAESHLFRATMLRTERTIRGLDSETVKAYRERQRQYGVAGLPHAFMAIRLASTDLERAQGERLAGELHVQQISGMVAGLVNGPKALKHITRALALAPGDPDCQRAQGLMFLYNPPINGGDVDRAIRTFRKCIEARRDSDEFHLYLALAFRKKGKLIRAEIAARKALLLNPANTNARYLLGEFARRATP